MTIQELETAFANIKNIPAQLKTKTGLIENLPHFINSHINYCKAHPKAKFTKPYLDRLIQLLKYLSKYNN